MTKHICSAAVMVSLLLLPVAIGDFAGVATAHAAVPEPGTLSLLTVGFVGVALSRRRRR
jgi:hypothetical protein